MNLAEIGYFSKTQGIKGHLILRTESEFYFEDLNAFFIESGGSKAPYFISEIKETNNGIVVLLEEIDSIEKAKQLIGKKVFIDSEFLGEETNEDDWIGFELIDEKLGSLGTIVEMNDTGYQVLVSIIYKDKEVILPLVDEFIERVDEPAKKIYFKSPEGLIDIYLDEK